MLSICPHTKGTTWKKVLTTWKEMYHNQIHIWATSLQTPWHRMLKCHLQSSCHFWWNWNHLWDWISSMEWPHCWGTVGVPNPWASSPTRRQSQRWERPLLTQPQTSGRWRHPNKYSWTTSKPWYSGTCRSAWETPSRCTSCSSYSSCPCCPSSACSSSC